MNKTAEHYAVVLRLITPILLALVLFIMNNININLSSLNENIFDHEGRISKIESDVNNLYRGKFK